MAGQGNDDLWDNEKKICIKGRSKYAWPETLGKLLSIPVFNLGIPGSSNKEIAYKISQFNFEEGDFVLIGWTFNERSCIINTILLPFIVNPANLDICDFQLSIHYNDPVNKQWKKHHTSNKNLQFESLMYVYGTQAYLTAYNIPFLQTFISNGLYNLDTDTTVLKNVYPRKLDYSYGQPGADGSHPSRQTYNIWAKQVYNWLITNKNFNFEKN